MPYSIRSTLHCSLQADAQLITLLLTTLLMILVRVTAASLNDSHVIDDDILKSNFEEYLLRVTTNDTSSSSTTGHVTASIASNSSEVIQEADVDTPTTIQLLTYFRTVPRQHWSCCMLGMLAGNKGFHCQADFYAYQTSTRNSNRPQTARQPGSRNSKSHWSYEITRTFRRCVAHHATEFHNCCFAATVERIELGRVEQYLSAGGAGAQDTSS